MTVENYWASPTVETRPQWQKFRGSMFTLICCSLAGLKMSLRTGFCCRNFLAQDKIKVRRKLYLSLQFWDGALLPPAVLGWHLLTCNILPPDLRWHLLTSNILPPDVRWHLLTLKMFFTGRFAIAPSHLQYFTARCAMAPSHLQYFTARCAMAPSHLQYFTARFAMAPYHLEHAFYRQICDSTFSP